MKRVSLIALTMLFTHVCSVNAERAPVASSDIEIELQPMGASAKNYSASVSSMEGAADEASRGFSPLLKSGTVDTAFTEMHRDLVDIVRLSYKYGENPTCKEMLRDVVSNWKLVGTFGGRYAGAQVLSGGFQDPNAGLLMYNETLNILNIVSHGSINARDWIANLETSQLSLGECGIGVNGHAHGGFLKKFHACVIEKNEHGCLSDRLDAFLDGLTDESRSGLRFVVSGHSQGAAMAQLISLWLAKRLNGDEATSINNNSVWGYFLAAPTVFNEVGAESFERFVGARNAVRHNVMMDIVPNAAPNVVTGLVSVGTLALQGTIETAFQYLRIQCSEVANGYALGNLSVLALPMTPLHALASEVRKINLESVFARRMAFSGVLASIAKLLTVSHMVGSNGFHPSLVMSNLDTMIADGQKHSDHQKTSFLQGALESVKSKAEVLSSGVRNVVSGLKTKLLGCFNWGSSVA